MASDTLAYVANYHPLVGHLIQQTGMVPILTAMLDDPHQEYGVDAGTVVAGLIHPDWNNLRASWDVSYYDDMTYVAATVINIPVEDPSIYDFSMGGHTSGTAYSGSQPFGFTGDFAVQTHAPGDLVLVSVAEGSGCSTFPTTATPVVLAV